MTPEMAERKRNAEKLKDWRARPQQMVRDLWDVEPDAWQEQVLAMFPTHPRIAMLACKGPGKTTILSWLSWNFLLTRPHPNIGAISITATNLRDGLWKEMAKWREMSQLLKAQFEWTQARIFNKDYPATWFMSAKSYSQSASREEQANALAGFHADYVMYVMDESGSMSDAVLVSAEATMSSCVEGHLVQAGNPTSLEGPLYHAHRNRHSWYVVEITADPNDPNRTPRIPVAYAEWFIKEYGEDNPWTQVNIFGRFPPGSINALLSRDQLEQASKRMWRPYQIGIAPRILGVDVARFGDDKSVVAPRHGIQLFPLIKRRGLDSNQGAEWVAREWDAFMADAAFVDDTGGFGSGWIDNLRRLGRSPIPVAYAGKANNANRYENKRAEMYFEAAEWVKAGGAIPEDQALIDALASTTYTFKKDKLLLEPKTIIKARLGFSPDEADAFAQTFAQPVMASSAVRRGGVRHQVEYDPFAGISNAMSEMNSDYDPFKG